MKNPKVILLVEDSDDDIFLFSISAKKALISSPVHVVRTGQEAMDYLSGNGEHSDRKFSPIPAIVFIDVKIPFVDGFFVLEWIRKQEEFTGIPLIMLSGSNAERDHQKAKDLGATNYLVKPILPEHFQAAMNLI
ncbi:MAG: response regulator [Verrucomicrobiota bacterium]